MSLLVQTPAAGAYHAHFIVLSISSVYFKLKCLTGIYHRASPVDLFISHSYDADVLQLVDQLPKFGRNLELSNLQNSMRNCNLQYIENTLALRKYIVPGISCCSIETDSSF